MKKRTMTLLTAGLSFLLALSCPKAKAQSLPRAIGVRGGPNAELSYQHTVGEISFIELDLGIDYFHTIGYRATCNYDFLFARPEWTRGDWGFYAGPGLSLGFVDDKVPIETPVGIAEVGDMGFMLGAALQIGMEYTFWFPLQIALDIRPIIGFHINDGIIYEGERYGSKFDFYHNGIWQLIPSLSLRYRF